MRKYLEAWFLALFISGHCLGTLVTNQDSIGLHNKTNTKQKLLLRQAFEQAVYIVNRKKLDVDYAELYVDVFRIILEILKRSPYAELQMIQVRHALNLASEILRSKEDDAAASGRVMLVFKLAFDRAEAAEKREIRNLSVISI